ncbi:hypothetical protein DN752_19265 [Echinicola strongylocentroti]|uniref:YtxH domain-containing protein n=1 Tax=Echinicola strongylocentroti TaxID=1795355 RepID=A0A2Z4IMN5_9BACT|nr:hypothetical protein [Echinicola strongylocentroti]AWW32104.1 hypothetical protein DN752_19265 [Echinicola strongylocentroti]
MKKVLALFAVAGMLSLYSCGNDKNDAEDKMEEAGDAVENTMEDAGEAVDDAADDVEKKAEETKEEIDESVN